MSSSFARVLVINPGSASTKIGVYLESGPEMLRTLPHSEADLDPFRHQSTLSQLEFRAAAIDTALQDSGFSQTHFAAVAGRGGLLPPTVCGTYRVDDAMIAELREARRGDHASNLGALLARRFADACAAPAFIVDPVTVDEWPPEAHFSGSPLLPRDAVGHALNTKAVARRFAADTGRAYPDLRLIVIHLGSGITVSAHQNGRMIDNNTPEDGPFGPDRTGTVPIRAFIRHAFQNGLTARQLDRQVFGEGGLYAYLGTRDLREIEQRIDTGDAFAVQVLDAMIYQIAKEAGSMAAVLHGRVDALLLTGGMAHSARLVDRLRSWLSWIAPIHVYPGEDELLALAEGAFRVLRGQEQEKFLFPAT